MEGSAELPPFDIFEAGDYFIIALKAFLFLIFLQS